jgi:hypothetical protein
MVSLVFGGIQIYQSQKSAGLTDLEAIMVITAFLLLLVVFVTGALLSFEKFAKASLTLIHKFGAFLLTLNAIAAIYIITKVNV